MLRLKASTTMCSFFTQKSHEKTMRTMCFLISCVCPALNVLRLAKNLSFLIVCISKSIYLFLLKIKTKNMAAYKRILLKLSGESLMGEKQYGIDERRLSEYANQIADVVKMGVQVGIVIGGGNIFRGLSGAQKGFDRVQCVRCRV